MLFIQQDTRNVISLYWTIMGNLMDPYGIGNGLVDTHMIIKSSCVDSGIGQDGTV